MTPDERLLERNRRFVVAVARENQGHGVALEDLIAAGNEGLREADRRYEPSSGVRRLAQEAGDE